MKTVSRSKILYNRKGSSFKSPIIVLLPSLKHTEPIPKAKRYFLMSQLLYRVDRNAEVSKGS